MRDVSGSRLISKTEVQLPVYLKKNESHYVHEPLSGAYSGRLLLNREYIRVRPDR